MRCCAVISLQDRCAVSLGSALAAGWQVLAARNAIILPSGRSATALEPTTCIVSLFVASIVAGGRLWAISPVIWSFSFILGSIFINLWGAAHITVGDLLTFGSLTVRPYRFVGLYLAGAAAGTLASDLAPGYKEGHVELTNARYVGVRFSLQLMLVHR